jgi:hypothetical protein
MGAVHFSIDPELVQALKQKLPLQLFFETGTYKGDTAAFVADKFADVFTVERSALLYLKASKRLKEFPNVTALLGNSPDLIAEMRLELASQSVVYWLDAHWCGGETSGATEECPLLAELAAIGDLNENSVILVDDARYFISPPPHPHDAAHWPDLDSIMLALHSIAKNTHRTWVINDVLIFAPKAIAENVIKYGQHYGVDLLNVMNTTRELA